MLRRLVITTLCSLAVVFFILLIRDAEQRNRIRARQEANRQRYFEQEQFRSRFNVPRAGRENGDQELVHEAIDKSNARGAVIRRTGNAFQRGDFASAVLDDATLEAGGASFQLACFDKASLRNAKLTGGAASFQGRRSTVPT